MVAAGEFLGSRRVEEVDPEMAQLIKDEQNRQKRCIELIASENFTSQAVRVRGENFTSQAVRQVQ
jgi:glycine hydroxymethyltransferase